MAEQSKKKVAVVTGASRGIGRAIALELASRGAAVVINYNGSEERAREVQKEIEEKGGEAEIRQWNVADYKACESAVKDIVKTHGSIDILVNCAGICKIADVLDFGRAEWDPMIAINLTGAFDLSHAVAKYMIPQRSGRIINICSLFSFLGGLGSPAYAAMKAGLSGLTKAYADELGKYGITVNGIAPGYFQTAMTAGTGSGNEEDPKYIKIKEHIPADRWGERQDLMGAMVFLASKAADYVNGTLLVVDGGYLVR